MTQSVPRAEYSIDSQDGVELKHLNTQGSMTQSVPRAKYSIDSQDGVELKHLNRQEEILRRLGVLYLDDKATRARLPEDESDAAILKEAGVYYVNTKEFRDAEESARADARRELEEREKAPKPLEPQVEEILRSAGVTLPGDGADPLPKQKPFKCDDSLPPSTTATTVAGTVGSNSTYAERELLRRLKHGWSSTGDECEECGMPVICKSKSDMLECVICGMIGDGENYDVTGDGDNYNIEDIGDPYVGDIGGCGDEIEGPGVFTVGGDSISAMTPSLEPSGRFTMDPIQETQSWRGYENDPEEERFDMDTISQLRGDQPIYSDNRLDIFRDQPDSLGGSHNAEEKEAFQEEIGQRLFEGWQLTELNCPSCDLPLMSKDDTASAVCLRCG